MVLVGTSFAVPALSAVVLPNTATGHKLNLLGDDLEDYPVRYPVRREIGRAKN